MIYLQIYDQKIVITNINNNPILKEKTYELDALTYKDFVIYDKTKILLPIKDFLSINKLQNPPAIISIPELTKNKQDLMQMLAVLQHVLILGKSGLKIEKIISDATPGQSQKAQKACQNLLDFFAPKYDIKPTAWVSLTLLCTIFLTTFLFNITQQNHFQLDSLTNKVEALKTQPLELANKTKSFVTLKKNSSDLSTLITNVKKYHAKKLIALPILTTISNKIPNNTWVTQISIGKKQKFSHNQLTHELKAKKLPQQLQILGYSKQISAPYKFMEKIENNTTNSSSIINNLKMAYVKRKKHSSAKQIHHKIYEFKLTGLLT